MTQVMAAPTDDGAISAQLVGARKAHVPVVPMMFPECSHGIRLTQKDLRECSHCAHVFPQVSLYTYFSLSLRDRFRTVVLSSLVAREKVAYVLLTLGNNGNKGNLSASPASGAGSCVPGLFPLFPFCSMEAL